MEQLPFYTYLLFGGTTLLTMLLLFRAAHHAKAVLINVVLWLALQAVISINGFYQVTNVMPPRFGLLLLPPVLLIILLFSTASGRNIIDRWDIRTLTLLHIIRIPVELTLYILCLHKAVPSLITFEGRNFDVFSGLSAPIIYYFGFIRNLIGRKTLIAWNILCLLLLANVVVTAVLSVPLPFQQFAFDQPNIALLYFPFVLLPSFLVPVVLLAHLVTLRRLLNVSV